MLYSIGRVIATEARAHGVHFILGPNLDLAHEIRWGRVEETFGEDPYLTSRLGVNLVKGMQGNDLRDNNTVASESKFMVFRNRGQMPHRLISANEKPVHSIYILSKKR